jgi:DNA-binding NarL/FixJ family response regulator
MRKSMKVLIVDDSQVLARCLRASLADVTGLDIVGHADCVAAGILEIRRAQPDVVILDIRMPDGSGIEVLESLKSHPLPPTVIMLTNYDLPQFRRKCLESGARYYFDKSTEFHRVGEVLRSLVEVPSV